MGPFGSTRPVPYPDRVPGAAVQPTTERRVSDPDGLLVTPRHGCGTSVLVLAGSSGRVDADRARQLARHGVTALSIRWFGGPGQQPGPYEVPLETFIEALDQLASTGDRLAVVGTSFGAEAALLTASRDPRVTATVAFTPTPVVWAGVAPGVEPGTTRQTSHWTWAGVPLPFVPLLEDWTSPVDPPAFRELYQLSRRAHPVEAAGAAIPVERIEGEVVLVAGEDDQVWPGADFAREIAARRAVHGLDSHVFTHLRAGHRTVLPGEPAVRVGMTMARGGSPSADAELGRLSWPTILEVLRGQGARST